MKKYFILLLIFSGFLFSCGHDKDEAKEDGKDSTQAQAENPLSYEQQEMMEMAERQKNAKPKVFIDTIFV